MESDSYGKVNRVDNQESGLIPTDANKYLLTLPGQN